MTDSTLIDRAAMEAIDRVDDPDLPDVTACVVVAVCTEETDGGTIIQSVPVIEGDVPNRVVARALRSIAATLDEDAAASDSTDPRLDYLGDVDE